MKLSKLLTRTNGLWTCIIGILIALITGYIPFINSDVGGFAGMAVFVLGLILIVVRWKYDSKDKILTRKIGIWLSAIGLTIFLSTPLAIYLWDMDIDIFGALIFIMGLVIMIVRWKK